MDGFQQYLESLPGAIQKLGPKDKALRDAVLHPYVVAGSTQSKTLDVHVPSQDITIKFEFDDQPFPTGYANNPYASLEQIAKDLIVKARDEKIEKWKKLAVEGFCRLPSPFY